MSSEEDVRDTNERGNLCVPQNAETSERRRPPGAMAPENTTQYLMSIVYEDVKSDDSEAVPVFSEAARLYDGSLSPRSVDAALDSGFDDCLAFQQRHFDEAFNQLW